MSSLINGPNFDDNKIVIDNEFESVIQAHTDILSQLSIGSHSSIIDDSSLSKSSPTNAIVLHEAACDSSTRNSTDIHDIVAFDSSYTYEASTAIVPTNSPSLIFNNGNETLSQASIRVFEIKHSYFSYLELKSVVDRFGMEWGFKVSRQGCVLKYNRFGFYGDRKRDRDNVNPAK